MLMHISLPLSDVLDYVRYELPVPSFCGLGRCYVTVIQAQIFPLTSEHQLRLTKRVVVDRPCGTVTQCHCTQK